MGSALRQAPSPVRGVRQNPQLLPSWSRHAQGWTKVEDTSVTPLCRMIFSARLLTNWSSFPLRDRWCLLCLLRTFSTETPALAGAGGPGRYHTRDRDPSLVLSWCQGSCTTKSFSPRLSRPLVPTAPQHAWGCSSSHQDHTEV